MKKKAARASKPSTVPEYLAGLSADKRAALKRLRRDILAAAPRSEECISYGLPAVRLDGRMLVWYGAGARHCAFYPGGVVQDLGDELDGYDTSKGTVRFPPERPLPRALVTKLVRTRIARNSETRGRADAGRTKRSGGSSTRSRRQA